MSSHSYPAGNGIYDLSAYESVDEGDLLVLDGVMWGKYEVVNYPDYSALQTQLAAFTAELPSSVEWRIDRQDPARGRSRLLMREPGKLPTPIQRQVLKGLGQTASRVIGWGGV